MKKTAIVFGGSGYIGRNMLSVFVKEKLFEQYIVCDLNELKGFEEESRVTYFKIDVRNKIILELNNLDRKGSWIFNFAAIHREPGHEFHEYFDTNIPGAKNVTQFGTASGIKNIYFTSSIAPYGRSLDKRTEDSNLYPETGYGISKALAEKIHLLWLAQDSSRRLIIVRPSVIFGPKDPGNVYRMISAIKKGTFVLPDGGKVIKAYAYIYGLIDSILFTMGQSDEYILYNYAENPLVPLNEMTGIVKDQFGYNKPVLKVPVKMLAIIAFFLGGILKFFGKTTDIHPVRVKKAGFPTNIEPRYLIDSGFNFKYDFKSALIHWNEVSPEDF
ncbi:NAD-dependent epimerase/dehydratase family protein [Maribacter sp. ACAM166]|uniref:NAD-dependent epimerase/dehydratase family protein n=1 Tax=Maribacter sp. ACAM166 TaxID=2508996 RepID=UPI0010FD81A4|nr:NAD(P)-dependent oxidoreductase [Maribacter sp. ACAM166]TLP80763.1 NAD(P)-dependent oxidoreductase [Maribacter sp. ACAM166]